MFSFASADCSSGIRPSAENALLLLADSAVAGLAVAVVSSGDAVVAGPSVVTAAALRGANLAGRRGAAAAGISTTDMRASCSLLTGPEGLAKVEQVAVGETHAARRVVGPHGSGVRQADAGQAADGPARRDSNLLPMLAAGAAPARAAVAAARQARIAHAIEGF